MEQGLDTGTCGFTFTPGIHHILQYRLLPFIHIGGIGFVPYRTKLAEVHCHKPLFTDGGQGMSRGLHIHHIVDLLGSVASTKHHEPRIGSISSGYRNQIGNIVYRHHILSFSTSLS